MSLIVLLLISVQAAAASLVSCDMCTKILPYVAHHECSTKCSSFWSWTQPTCEKLCVELAKFSPTTACWEAGYCPKPLMMQTAPTMTTTLSSSSSSSSSLSSPPLATPNQIYDASTYSKKIISTKNGVLYEVNAPDTAPLKVMHLYGDAYERGVAHGSLLSDELVQFMTTDLQSYFLQECDQIPVDKLPKWLAAAIVKLCQDAAPTAFDLALGWVWDQQVKYINASKTNVVEEMQGIAAGICTPARINATVPSLCTNPKKLLKTIYNVNMLPEVNFYLLYFSSILFYSLLFSIIYYYFISFKMYTDIY